MLFDPDQRRSGCPISCSLDLLGDIVRNSQYDPQEIEKGRKFSREELAGVNESPQHNVDVLINEAVRPGQPLGRDIAGRRESVSAITREMPLG